MFPDLSSFCTQQWLLEIIPRGRGGSLGVGCLPPMPVPKAMGSILWLQNANNRRIVKTKICQDGHPVLSTVLSRPPSLLPFEGSPSVQVLLQVLCTKVSPEKLPSSLVPTYPLPRMKPGKFWRDQDVRVGCLPLQPQR